MFPPSHNCDKVNLLFTSFEVTLLLSFFLLAQNQIQVRGCGPPLRQSWESDASPYFAQSLHAYGVLIIISFHLTDSHQIGQILLFDSHQTGKQVNPKATL